MVGRKITNFERNLRCVASDPDKDKLIHEWLTDGGSASGEGPVVTWASPCRGGEVTVTVTVSDSRNGIATKSIVFRVKTRSCAFR